MSDGLKPGDFRRCHNPGCRVIITGWAGEKCHECYEPARLLKDSAPNLIKQEQEK